MSEVLQIAGGSAAGAFVAVLVQWVTLSLWIGRTLPDRLAAHGKWAYWRAAFGQLWSNPTFCVSFVCWWVGFAVFGYILSKG